MFGVPRQVLFVGDNTSSEGGSVVAAETDEHDSKLGDTSVGADFLFLDDWLGRHGLLVEEGKSGLVVNLDVVVGDLAFDSGEGGGFLVGAEGEFAVRNGRNDYSTNWKE